MEKLSNSSHFLDLGGLDSLRVQAQKDEKGTLREAAKQFEGIFIQMLMKSMRDANAAFKSDSPMNSQTTEFFEQMRDQQMSVDLSNKGMLGLADLMVQQLSPDESPITPASVLRGGLESKVAPSMFVDKDTLNSTPVISLDEIASSHHALASPLDDVANSTAQVKPFESAASTQPQLQQVEQVLRGEVSSGKSLPQSKNIAANAAFTGPEHFVSMLYPHAEKAAKALGTTPEVLIAQSALETGWGKKMIRRNDGTISNNLFNIKADKRWGGNKTTVSTLEFEKGIAVKQKADFRMYDNLEQSFKDFVSFLEDGERYQEARKVASEPVKFIHALQKAGYATDPHYAKKVLQVMESVTDGLKSVLVGENK
ncbi:Mannosyl-glycoprotein endo-beta-N-acetylglucosamidase [Shewanella denitrificans OS217]|jgi:peptidoglycan hydrolase FlgJ|uniref:Peptidoglycan hydrolase FlgJ n=1 Tax=Shewanella denitrificans (strain OS217 / ATCC BAA-1090 / DSM 15013) TaxID=318161 RepID=Q12PM9_SHEDO|nr:flagellar assembly peptidoglycan hydrolase FlgJ [Shewanella denitrificans]ABE54597.1 Mannosyl-glycoprotein endo-beta-N-acetylglucosamidase [Shewanella denitrificans OS217]